MILGLNGVFCWFKNLSEFWQMVLVTGAIFSAGMSAGLFVYAFKGVPANVSQNTERVEVLEHRADSIQSSQDQIIVTVASINTKLDTISGQVSEVYRRVNVLSCYQENVAGESLRTCILESLNRNENPSVSSNGNR